MAGKPCNIELQKYQQNKSATNGLYVKENLMVGITHIICVLFVMQPVQKCTSYYMRQVGCVEKNATVAGMFT